MGFTGKHSLTLWNRQGLLAVRLQESYATTEPLKEKHWGSEILAVWPDLRNQHRYFCSDTYTKIHRSESEASDNHLFSLARVSWPCWGLGELQNRCDAWSLIKLSFVLTCVQYSRVNKSIICVAGISVSSWMVTRCSVFFFFSFLKKHLVFPVKSSKYPWFQYFDVETFVTPTPSCTWRQPINLSSNNMPCWFFFLMENMVLCLL